VAKCQLLRLNGRQAEEGCLGHKCPTAGDICGGPRAKPQSLRNSLTHPYILFKKFKDHKSGTISIIYFVQRKQFILETTLYL